MIKPTFYNGRKNLLQKVDLESIINLMVRALSENRPAMRECDGLLSEVLMKTVQHSEELICIIFQGLKGKEAIAIQFRFMSKYFLPYELKITGSKLIYQAGRETAFFQGH